MKAESVILIRGAGEKASAVAHRLATAGFSRIVLTEIARPSAERRAVCFSEAVAVGRQVVEGIEARLCAPRLEALRAVWAAGNLAVAVDPELSLVRFLRPAVVVDAVMAKRNTGTRMDLAPLVVALGPGFTAGIDAHKVVETNPASPSLGRVIDHGSADADTQVPTEVDGLTHQRLLHSPADGTLEVVQDIGAAVRPGQVVASVAGRPVVAGIQGVVWGLVRSGVRVRSGAKVGDIDPRGDPALCRRITPQSRAIADGVLAAVGGPAG